VGYYEKEIGMNLPPIDTLQVFPTAVRQLNARLAGPVPVPLDGSLRCGSPTGQKIFEFILKAEYTLHGQYNVKGETIVMPPDIYHEAIASFEFLRFGAIRFDDPRYSVIDATNGVILPKIFGMDIEIGNKFEVKSSPQHNRSVDLTHLWHQMWFCFRNLVILVKSRVRDEYQDFSRMSPEESKALDTLREMISEADFRRYLVYGFILVKGQSGKVYQIFRVQHHTKVWEKGKKVEEVCAYIKDHKIPPTDKLIAFKTMIETDEELFRKAGNLYKFQGT